MSRHFNGTSDGLLNAAAAALDAQPDITLFAWLAPEKVATQTIIRFGDPGVAPFVNWGIAATAAGKIEGQYDIGGTLWTLDSTTSHPTDGSWIAVGLTVTSGAQNLYYNGASQANAAHAGAIENLADNRFSVGYSPAFGERFQGKAAHVAVWNVALSAADMASLAAGANPLAVQPGSLIGYWPLAGTASPEPDEVGATDLAVTGTTQGANDPPVDPPPGGGVAPSNTIAPAITDDGTPQTGETVTVSDGTWSGDAPITFTYQWKRAGVAIAGETGDTYALQAADEGQSVLCTVTATNATGSASADSNAIVPSAATGAPQPTCFVKWAGARVASVPRVKAGGALYPPL